jgi:5-formyltetrahydrofolate cyclo-ligase
LFAAARRIAAYWAQDGEVDTAVIWQRAWSLGKQIFLPVLSSEPQGPMLFALFQADTALAPNRFGIPEPRTPTAQCLSGQQLDLVLTPLVAFAENGRRLGMGGGFYDRAFAFRRGSAPACKPHLLGLAFELQKVECLPSRPWDVPLDGIVTESAFYEGFDSKAPTSP